MTGLREEKSDEAELSRDLRPAGVLPLPVFGVAAEPLGVDVATIPAVDRDGVDTVDSKFIVDCR